MGSTRTVLLPLFVDPRRWSSGSARQVDISTVVPKGLASGSYEVLLNLPDAAPSLHRPADYAIRLANKGTWEPRTGYNRLLMQVTVR